MGRSNQRALAVLTEAGLGQDMQFAGLRVHKLSPKVGLGFSVPNQRVALIVILIHKGRHANLGLFSVPHKIIGLPFIFLLGLVKDIAHQLADIQQKRPGTRGSRSPGGVISADTGVCLPQFGVISAHHVVEAEHHPFVILERGHPLIIPVVIVGGTFTEGRLHIPGQQAGIQVGVVEEGHAVILVVGIAVHEVCGSEHQGAFLSGLVFPDVVGVAVLAGHLDVDALGVLDGDVIGIGVAAGHIVIVKVVRDALAGGEIPQMHGVTHLGRQGILVIASSAQGLNTVLREAQYRVKLHIRTLCGRIGPVAVDHETLFRGSMHGIWSLVLFFAEIVIGGVEGLDAGPALGGLAVFQHVEGKDLPHLVVLVPVNPFEIGFLRGEVIHIFGILGAGHQIGAGGHIVHLPVIGLAGVGIDVGLSVVGRIEGHVELHLRLQGVQLHLGAVIDRISAVIDMAPDGRAGIYRRTCHTQHHEKVRAVHDLLPQGHFHAAQKVQGGNLREAVQGIGLSVQRRDGVGDIGQHHQRAVLARYRGNFHHAARRGVNLVVGIVFRVLHPPAFIRIRFQI